MPWGQGPTDPGRWALCAHGAPTAPPVPLHVGWRLGAMMDCPRRLSNVLLMWPSYRCGHMHQLFPGPRGARAPLLFGSEQEVGGGTGRGGQEAPSHRGRISFRPADPRARCQDTPSHVASCLDDSSACGPSYPANVCLGVQLPRRRGPASLLTRFSSNGDPRLPSRPRGGTSDSWRVGGESLGEPALVVPSAAPGAPRPAHLPPGGGLPSAQLSSGHPWGCGVRPPPQQPGPPCSPRAEPGASNIPSALREGDHSLLGSGPSCCPHDAGEEGGAGKGWGSGPGSRAASLRGEVWVPRPAAVPAPLEGPWGPRGQAGHLPCRRPQAEGGGRSHLPSCSLVGPQADSSLSTDVGWGVPGAIS